MSNALSQAIVYLFENERFYAELIARMERRTRTDISWAAVSVTDRVNLYINPKSFDPLPVETRAAILKHECEHILRSHLSRAKELLPDVYATQKPSDDVVERIASNITKNSKHRYVNMAADLAINPGITDLPQGVLYPKLYNMPDGLTMEAYLEQLKEGKHKQNPQPGGESIDGDGCGEYDDHKVWDESDENKETLKEKIRQAVDKAAKETRAAGKMTAEHELLVSQLQPPTVNWQSTLKRFVARSIEAERDTSMKRRNRRYGTMYPGIIKGEETLKLGVAIDTSGSVSDEALQQFMSEIATIAKYAAVHVVEADTEIKNSYDFKAKQVYKLAGRGGTAYRPAFDYFDKYGIDAMIYFGDMDNYDQEALIKPKYPVLWAIIGNQPPPADFGSQVKVEVIKKAA